MVTATSIAPPHTTRSGPFVRQWTPAEFAVLCRLGPFAGRTLSLRGGDLVEHRTGVLDPVPVTFTRPEFYALWDAQLFSGQLVQLIGGTIVQEPRMTPPHATAVRKATRVLDRAFPTGHVVRSQLPLSLGATSEPHPYVAVVSGSVDDYATAHPTTAVLVVEVADSTLDHDTTTKAELYATAGILDYWVLDVVGRQLLAYRDPAPLPAGLGGAAYRTHLTLGPADAVSPLAMPTAAVKVADCLP
ncbi:MAG: Uma2 family endonuclease [Gemmataceae bacterium]|nr:Uma2 family endonuclease [Gemmataceae bacterium]